MRKHPHDNCVDGLQGAKEGENQLGRYYRAKEGEDGLWTRMVWVCSEQSRQI